jgi:hypothetical protein
VTGFVTTSLPDVRGRALCELPANQPGDQLGGIPVVAGRAVTIDLNGDPLVGVADRVAEDLGVNALSQQLVTSNVQSCEWPWWINGKSTRTASAATR